MSSIETVPGAAYQDVTCSFCGRHNREVHMVAGRDGLTICQVCVAGAAASIDADSGRPVGPWATRWEPKSEPGPAEALWERFDALSEEDFVAEMEALVGGSDDPSASFELASAYDSTGREEDAVSRYRAALAGGLPAYERRRATIQLASTLRNLGRHDESIALLEPELDVADSLSDAVRAFLALALTSAGRPVEAVSLALTALAPHLARYTRSLTAYAAELRDNASR